MIRTLDALNGMAAPDFVDALGDVFEHAPWVAERAWHMRPFHSVTALHQAMFNAVRGLTPLERIAFFNRHPDLGAVATTSMTASSAAEQGGLGLNRLDAARLAQLRAANGTYRMRFGFPFILCARRHSRASVFDCLARRLRNDLASERASAMDEVFFITRLRLTDRVTGPGMPSVHGRLGAQVLDDATARPVANVPLALFEIDAEAMSPIIATTTNEDGHADLRSGAPLRIGRYELRFDMRSYLPHGTTRRGDPDLLDSIPFRFAIAAPESDYHVKLRVSPSGYTLCAGKDFIDG